MISIRNLVKRYDDQLPLQQLNLRAEKGIIFGRLGPNGAGKTTLISILNGLTNFQEGEIEILGLPLRKNLKAIRRRSTFIPQSLALYDHLSVIENLRFFAGIQSISGETLRKNIDYAISVNRLQPLTEKKASTLSGGQKRRLNIAIGLLNNPDILYFDEPTVGIDPESRGEILETIRSFKHDNKTVIYTSHYMEEIEKICDEAAILNAGEIVRQGSLTSLLQNNNDHSAVIECIHPNREQLSKIADGHDGTELFNSNKLMVLRPNSKKMAALLADLEAKDIQLKQIRYDSINLESLFISLTSRENPDA